MSKDEANAFESITRLRGQGRAPGRLSLLIMGAAGVQTVPLPAEGELIVGRSEQCQVRIDDDNLSRKHLRLRIGDDVEVEDLESLNGSKLGDHPLRPGAPERLREGDVITIGDSVMVLQRSNNERPRHLWGHAYFEARLEDECVRAAHEPRSFSVLRLRLGRAELGATAEALWPRWWRRATPSPATRRANTRCCCSTASPSARTRRRPSCGKSSPTSASPRPSASPATPATAARPRR